MTVTIAYRRSTYVLTYARAAAPGPMRSTAAVMTPAITMSVPAAASQPSVNVVAARGLPPLRTCRPGQANLTVHGALARAAFTAWMLAIEKTAMMMTYGAYARMMSARLFRTVTVAPVSTVV